MGNKEIYTITTVKKEFIPGHSFTRCVGYSFDLERAKEIVMCNEQSISELGHYQYCVIEKILPGLYHLDREEWWFQWDWESDIYVSIDNKPDQFYGMICFGLG